MTLAGGTADGALARGLWLQQEAAAAASAWGSEDRWPPGPHVEAREYRERQADFMNIQKTQTYAFSGALS